jgi:hypothetical protein
MGILNNFGWIAAGILAISTGFIGWKLGDSSADIIELKQQVREEKNRADRAAFREQTVSSSLEEIRNSIEGTLTRRHTLVKEIQIVNAQPTTQGCGPSVRAAVDLMRDEAEPTSP